MLVLNQCNALGNFKTFSSKNLSRIVEDVGSVDQHLTPVYKEFLLKSKSKELSAALEALIAKSSTAKREVTCKRKKTIRSIWSNFVKRYTKA